MKKIEVISDIRSFDLYKNKLILKKTDGSLYIEDRKFIFKGEAYIILENGSFCDIQKTQVDVYDNSFSHLTRIEKEDVIAVSRIPNTHYFSVRWENDNDDEFLSIYRDSKELIVYDYFIGVFLGLDYRIVFNDYAPTEIEVYHDIIEDKFLWSYTCPKGRKIEGNLYTYEGILVFIEKDDKAHTTLVGLDLQTGNILYKVAVGLINYRQQANKLYGFASNSFGDNTYLEIDITKGEVCEKSFPNYKRDVTGGLFTIKDDYLYYSIFKEGSIGVIDINKKEIIREEKLDIKEGVQIGAPVVTEDKIYILDSENVLHIYERDF
ncbi:hypothetical protein KRX57_06040 [Weeksellaceae bacterium TAE3-ERU29]|nr:hypothetical protein [Weeksellaceae bacterium TAE3-ERU29]